MSDYRNLHVWHKSHALALDVYRLTNLFPDRELYGLTSQMRRASTSIPMNIAEGCGRGGQLEFVRFLTIAAGSAKELEYQSLLACDLGYLSKPEYERVSIATVEVERMLSRLIQKLRGPARAVTRRSETTNYHLSPIT